MVWRTGKAPTIGDAERAQAKTDLKALGVDVIVLDPKRGKVKEATDLVSQLLQAEPVRIADVLVWQLADGVAKPAKR